MPLAPVVPTAPPAVASAIVPLTVASATVPSAETPSVWLPPALLLPVVPEIDTVALSTEPAAEASFVRLPALLLPVLPEMETLVFDARGPTDCPLVLTLLPPVVPLVLEPLGTLTETVAWSRQANWNPYRMGHAVRVT